MAKLIILLGLPYKRRAKKSQYSLSFSKYGFLCRGMPVGTTGLGAFTRFPDLCCEKFRFNH